MNHRDHTSGEQLNGAVGARRIAFEDPLLAPEAGVAFLHQRRFVRRRRSPTTRVSVVIPAMNEERNIEWVLNRLPAEIDEVILVDGASVDNTVAVSLAVRPDIRVVRQEQMGKGAALRAGFAAAQGDVIVMIDADCSMDPWEIRRFLAMIEEGYDLVKGSRFMTSAGTTDMSFVRRCGNGFLRGLLNRLYRTQFTDLCYGFMAFRRDRLEALDLEADGFEIETEIVVRAVKCDLRVAEVRSFEAPRAHGASNLKAWRDGRRVLRLMLRHRFERGRPVPVAPEQAAVSDLAAAAADSA